MSVRTRLAALSLPLGLGLAGQAVGGPNDATKSTKVPITTASAEARQAYLGGRDLFEKLRIQQARGEFERAVKLDPNFALAYLNLANTQPTTKEFFETLKKASALADRVSPGERLMIQGGEAAGSGDNAAQVKIYEELVAAYPDDERALTLLGTAHFGGQRYSQAITQYEKAVRISPQFSSPYNLLGYSYRFLNEPAKAETAFKKYIELIPDDPNPYDSYAELLLKLGRYDESITMYRKALSIDPTFIASQLGIATDLDLLGKSKEARQELDALYRTAKDDGQRRAALFAKTVSYAHEGNFASAQSEMDKQYAMGEKIGDTLAMSGDLIAMGNLALESGDVAGAERRYRRALEIVEASPTVAEANKENQRRLQPYFMGRVALAKNDLAGAKAQSATLADKVAGSGNVFQKKLAHELAGQIALAEKRWDQAIEELSLANQQDPYNLYRLSLAYAGKGDSVKAKDFATRANADNSLTNLNYAFVRKHLRGPG
jgi:tetratricopeptide (TPR) repeat protein